MEQILGEALIPQVDYTSTSYGSVLLKSLQTEKLPELDLLVREAVQNSSDAALDYKESDSVWIDFKYKNFDAEALCEQLGAIGREIGKNRPDIISCKKCLEIRDRKTTGLTGPYKKEELNKSDHGNYFKLIFDSGINQTQAGAGGNWGFGKSVYYRISRAGIVVYYSQIRLGGANDENSPTEERLVVTMVEDESRDDSILSSIIQSPSGRAWWGRIDTDRNTVLPITDHNSIEALLNIFGLEPFEEGETDTSVIIPFIDEDKTMSDIIPNDSISEDVSARCVWKNSVPLYIKHALQKWYAPRLGNKALNNLDGAAKKIRATIHEDSSKETIRPQNMDCLFKLVQDLYNAALYACKKKNAPECSFPIQIKTQAISIRREGLAPGPVGYVAYAKASKQDIYWLQASLSPYILTGNFNNNEDENEPIVMFAREPGMIISYSIDGTWSKAVKAPINNAGSSSDEYIMAFFVPIVEKKFDADSGCRAAEYGALGGYLRKCEDSDHASWEDKAKFKLISKIKNNVGKKIAEGTRPAETAAVAASASRLSGRLGRALMPSKGLLAGSNDKKGPSKKGGENGGGSPSGARTTFKTKDPIWKEGALIIPYEMGMGAKAKRTIQIEAQTEAGTLPPKTWNDEIGSAFPASFSRATAVLRKTDGSEDSIECSLPSCSQQFGAISAQLHIVGGSATAFEISCNVPAQLISGELELITSDKTIECVLKAI